MVASDSDVMHATGHESPSWVFYCPGCECAHGINAGWSFDGDVVRPTIRPSILVRGETRCHSFVTAGKIRYLADCDHELAGCTVDLLPWDAVP